MSHINWLYNFDNDNSLYNFDSYHVSSCMQIQISDFSFDHH